MGFLSGRVSFVRYRVSGRGTKVFGAEHLEKLAAHAIGRQRLMSADGVQAGWIAGDHILDTRFDSAKNIADDALQFALRVDSLKIPGDLLRAYTQIELEGLAAGNPSGLPSARQKREARQAARQRLEQEAKDGRFIRRKDYPILWDSRSHELLVGSTAMTVADRLHTLFHETFGQKFEMIGAGRKAYELAETRKQTRGVDDGEPSQFVPGGQAKEVAWAPDETSRDFFGNEFLLWLWFYIEAESDTIELGDGSEATIMLARNLVLECPRGQTGRESITSDAPTRLPEARRAIQSGKLPRRTGLIAVRHDRQYELTLHAETLAVSGAKLPALEEEEERARVEERITILRHLVETLDLLYDAFTSRRCGESWPKELARIRKWLQQG
jgi:recombination associated protein RdgC